MEGKNKRMDRKERLKNENSPVSAKPYCQTYRKDQGGLYYCHKYQANGCRVSWQLGEDKGISLRTHSLVLQAFFPPECQHTLLHAFDDWTSLIPFLIFPDVICSQPPCLFFCPHPTQFIVLHSYLSPASDQLFSYLWHCSPRNKPQTVSLSLSLPSYLSLCHSFFPLSFPHSIAHPSSLSPSSGLPSGLEDHRTTSSRSHFLLTPVQDDVLVSQAAVLHSAAQASRLCSPYIQGYPDILSPVCVGHDVSLLSARLLLLAPQPRHPHRFWVESWDVADQPQAARPGRGATGQPGLQLHWYRKQQ